MIPTAHDALPFIFKPLWDYDNRVFAHYFPSFPLSIDNRDPPNDYYNVQFLTTTGEGGKHAAYGGFLRSRPLAVPPMQGSPTKQVYSIPNLKREIEMAISRGITGFCHNILSVSDGLTGTVPWMLQAAGEVDPRFKIIPMPDMNALASAHTSDFINILTLCAQSDSVMRLRDGRMVITAYNAPARPLSFWTDLFHQLNAAGINVAFMPTLVGGPSDAGGLNPVSWGVGAWGTATPAPSAALNPDKAHAAGLKFMSPVDPQQSRPKSKKFWEAANYAAFLNSFTASSNTGCDFVQLVTWNDYSEACQCCPCTNAAFNPSLGTGFYDLTAFFATLFATGYQPEITQDVLYFAYRQMQLPCVHPQQSADFTVETTGGTTEIDEIQVVAFLMTPGIVEIAVGAQVKQRNCDRGIQSFRVPLAVGTPVFTLIRNGSNVFSGKGPMPIVDSDVGLPSGILDMTYLSGSITRNGLTSYEFMVPHGEV
jgi:hypothetical protein